MITKHNQRRYRLHQLIKKLGYRYHAKQKTVFVSFATEAVHQHVEELRDKFNYNVQFEIV